MKRWGKKYDTAIGSLIREPLCLHMGNRSLVCSFYLYGISVTVEIQTGSSIKMEKFCVSTQNFSI